MKGAFQRYRVMAYVTGVVLATATIWALIGYLFLGYGSEGGKPGLYSAMWVAHGWLYFIYLITAVDLSFRMRYSLPKTLGILIAGTIPFMSFVAEHFVRKDVLAKGVLNS
jgi:integral membrane protein